MNNKFKNKGLSGLANVGNSCYINACMQLISHTYELNELLNIIDLSKVNNNLDGIFLKEWNDLRNMLWSSNCTIAPNRFVNIIQKISKNKNILEFSGYMQNDLQEFLIFVIDTLHNGLKREVDMNINGISKNEIDKLAIDCYKMMQKMYNKEYSEILNIFYGIQINQIKSINNTEILSRNSEPFSILALSIPKVNNCTIYDCFDEFTKDEIMENENAWFNEKTNLKENIKKNTLFWNLPNVLIIVLKRYDNFNKKISILVDSDNEINLSKYICGYNKESYVYKLFGTANHKGTAFGGHYTANIKYLDEKWYNINDTLINELNKNMVITASTYCLFYRKKNKE
tara:strand:- start:1238 stop:2263 length:1026 start_codon:yes stop_codon:yes gene_type:complete